MLYNIPRAQLLLPAGPALANDGAVAARPGGCQFAGIRLLHLQLHLLLCATRQPWRVLHALGGPRRAAGSAEWPIARLPPACSAGEGAAGTTADLHSHPRLHCLVAAAALRTMQFEMRLRSTVGEFYQHCDGLLPDCRLLLANSNQVEFD